MYSINRQIAIIKPKEPYVKWINSLPGSENPCDIEELNSDCTAFLIPHFDYNSESNKFMKKMYKKIFEIELEGWNTDKRTWPKKRSFSLFEKWFHIEFHSEVIDMLGTDIEKEDY